MAGSDYSRQFDGTHLDIRDQSWPIYNSVIISLGLLIIYYLAHHVQSSDLGPLDLLWNIFVWFIPSRLLAALDPQFIVPERSELTRDFKFGFKSGLLASKSHAARRILGREAEYVQSQLRRVLNPGILNHTNSQGPHNAPPGLGNWDNSCYQNSVLQGLAAFISFQEYLSQKPDQASPAKIKDAFKDLIKDMQDQKNAGRTLWTPSALKNMSSWQQQDAQEYMSKILDEIEKEVLRQMHQQDQPPGLESYEKSRAEIVPRYEQNLASPLDGLLAQRVGCQSCKYVEGLTMVPFNCLMLSITTSPVCDIQTSLSEFTAFETLDGVECNSCTIIRAKQQLTDFENNLTSNGQGNDTNETSKSPNLLQSLTDRLCVINNALQANDFSDENLKMCQIGPKNRVTTRKSRQVVIARAPKCLVVHLNRSQFNEVTGELSKNYAAFQFPKLLELGPWCLGGSSSEKKQVWSVDPSHSMRTEPEIGSAASPVYQIKAVLTHFGRHENGHYICYKQTPFTPEDEKGQRSWFRLSDEQVSEVSEEDVLAHGGAFMLFYEQVPDARDSL